MGFRLVSDTIYGSCQDRAKMENVNQNFRLRLPALSLFRCVIESGHATKGYNREGTIAKAGPACKES